MIVAFKGHDIQKIMLPPEQRMSRAERAKYEAERKRARVKAKREGTKVNMPPIPEPYKRIRPDVMALWEKMEHHELRGLTEIKIVVQGVLREYRVYMLVQRNGLAAVRARESEKWQ